jgi:hypothetical protein
MHSYVGKKHIWIFLLFVSFLQHLHSQDITKNVPISSCTVNNGIVQKKRGKLVVNEDSKNEIITAKIVLFTHFRMDMVWADQNLIQHGLLVFVPNGERTYFTIGAFNHSDIMKIFILEPNVSDEFEVEPRIASLLISV